MTGDTEMKSNIPDEEGFIDIAQYRKLVRNLIDMRRYQTALFWAEKVAVITQNDPFDIYWQAQCLFLLREYHRASHIIKFYGLEKTHILCHYLVVECLLEAKEYTEALGVLNSVDVDDMAASMLCGTQQNYEMGNQNLWMDETMKNDVLASICYLKGKVFEAMDNRTLAMDCYVQALQKSVYCTEALDALVQHEMLMAWEEKELMQHLPFSQQCTDAEAKFIKKLYESKLKKYYESLNPLSNAEQTPIGNMNTLQSIRELTEKMRKNRSNEVNINKDVNTKLLTPNSILSPANKILHELKNTPSYSLQSSLSRISMVNEGNRASENTHKSKLDMENGALVPMNSCMVKIQNSLDMMAATAERLFYDCDYKKCLKILEELLKRDPYHSGGLTIQIGCLVELKDFNKLFYVAHKLVDLYPDKAISWYAVGCYYDLIGKSDPARRYLAKATSLDRLYGPAWLAYGHSFAKENEHDQAMAAYFKATQLMRGCHLPLLYIGVECGLTKNLELAEKFFYQAMSIAPLDVFVLHELGVIKFEYEYYESAEEVFRTTADIVTNRAKQDNEPISPRWEPLFNNLGHCCRKNKKYKEALEYHQMALLLKPQNAETYTAMGFVHALTGKLEEAIELFHKSLSLNRDSVVTSTILKTCLEDMMEESSMFDNIFSKYNNKNQPKSPAKRSNVAADTAKKLNCVKLKFDEFDASPGSDAVDNVCDMSMDT
ncbi:unnamed protein product [Hermetia illucens]|uniref:Uncharacterized protein n=1 Tax=Hermetia illucens TaxID=343691 RepID=A0A7R8UA13_HERIL|nr:cell division cycle protein 16 homolog [Hermetia illucens]CAD7076949.1 unnamed protein product [Hermetia illucens]